MCQFCKLIDLLIDLRQLNHFPASQLCTYLGCKKIIRIEIWEVLGSLFCLMMYILMFQV